MSREITVVMRRLGFTLALAMIVGLVLLMLFVDVVLLHNAVGEMSVTEFSQEAFLLLTGLLFLHLALKKRECRGGYILIAGFFFCLFIREMDFVLDNIAHGSWFYFAVLCALLSIGYALCSPGNTVTGLAYFLQHDSYSYMVCGLLTVLVFSRLFGMHLLWEALMGNGYLRVVKNVAEEGSELFGYTLCLISGVLYTRSVNQE